MRNYRAEAAFFLGALALTSLACGLSGQILTPEEATRQAEEEAAANVIVYENPVDGLQPGDKATVVGRSLLVNMYAAPGGKISGGEQKGGEATVLEAALMEGEVWYKIEAPGGTWWVKTEALEPIEGAIEDEDRIKAGDTVFLIGKRYIVDMYKSPGGFIGAGQERGVEVTVVATALHDDALWYLIEAPTGQGWVPEDNIALEAPAE